MSISRFAMTMTALPLKAHLPFLAKGIVMSMGDKGLWRICLTRNNLERENT
ncbi:hypothetical protein K8S19_13795 [bacterium]|nr:hypothetical protein [bacterium]